MSPLGPDVHIGLNLVYLVPGETGGMEVVARELIPALRAAAPDLRITALVNREAAEYGHGPWIEDLPHVTVPVRARNRLEWVRGEQQALPRLARRHGIDLVHSLASTGPGWGPFRRVTTIHDLIYKVIPDSHPGLRSLGMRVLVPLAARRSHRVLVDSASTRDDVVRHLNVPAGRIDVVPLGVSTAPPASALAEAEVRARYELGDRPMVLSVSAKRRHKNLPRLLDALARFPADGRPVLIVPGYHSDHEDELRSQAAALGLDADVRLPGWVDDAELEGLYATATAMVFPSLYEGFGLPVLEAMRRGVPVACSDRSSLPEVAGDAALTFDPERSDEIAAAIERLLADGDLRDQLAAAGRERAARFTWEATARGVLRGYQKALAG